MSKCIAIPVLCLCGLLALSAQSLSANIIYTYTGNLFDNISSDAPDGISSDYLTIQFTTDLPGNEDFPSFFGSIVISDQILMATEPFFGDAIGSNELEFDSSGNVSAWNFYVIDDFLPSGQVRFIESDSTTGDVSNFSNSPGPAGETGDPSWQASVARPGTWTMRTITPEPRTPVLLCGGIGLLLWFKVRSRHPLSINK